MQIKLDLTLDELGRIVSLLKKWRKYSVEDRTRMTDAERTVSLLNKIEAIKMVRTRTGAMLLEAKNIVEAG